VQGAATVAMGFVGGVFEHIDPVLAQRFVVVFCSFLLWTTLFLVIFSRPASKRLIQRIHTTGKGPRLERQELANRICAFLHSIIVSYGAMNELFLSNGPLRVRSLLDRQTWPDYFAYSPDLLFYACLSTGFFIADLMLVTVLLEENGIAFFVHAVLGLCAGMYVIFTGWGMGYYAMLLLVECSTPFLHFRWFLLEYGFKGSMYEVVNGLALVAVFTFVRNVLCNVVSVNLVYELHTSLVGKVSLATRLVFSANAVAMVTLNTIWGFALWKGFIRTLKHLVARAPPAAKRE